MAGKVRQLIDEYMKLRGNGDQAITFFVRSHLILSGVHPDRFDESSEDDPEKVRLMEKMIHDFRASAR